MVDIEPARNMKAVKGRFSFHMLTAAEAFAEAQAGPFAASTKSVAEAKPYVNLLITQSQYDKILAKIVDEFLPMCAAQYKIGDKEKQALSPADIKGLLQQLENGSGPYNTPFKLPSDKTLELMPECAMQLKLLGKAGSSFDVEAIVNDESELAVPDPDWLKGQKKRLPIGETKHRLFKGCWVISPLRLYSYRNGKNPGFSAGSNYVCFSRKDTEFAAGPQIDTDSIFAADEED